MSEGNGLAGVDQLFAPRARRHLTVDLPVSGLRVRIQSLTERELSEYQAAILSKTGQVGSYSRQRLIDASRRLIVLCMVDSAGNRMLNDTHLERLAEWDAADAAFLYDECSRHCGINKSDVEDLAKNSGNVRVAD